MKKERGKKQMKNRKIKKKEKEEKRDRPNSPRKQYPIGNRPADRTPPMRLQENIKSQKAAVPVCFCSTSSCSRV